MLREALVDLRLRRTGTAPAAVPEKRSRSFAAAREAARIPAENLFRTYQTGPNGLSEPDAAERLEQHGPNQVAHERPPTWYVQLWHGFANAFSTLLATLGSRAEKALANPCQSWAYQVGGRSCAAW